MRGFDLALILILVALAAVLLWKVDAGENLTIEEIAAPPPPAPKKDDTKPKRFVSSPPVRNAFARA